jgi:SAM-dependent methyltransferase
MMGPKSVESTRFARTYVRRSQRAEDLGGRQHRARLLSEARGSVIELGAGHGLNFAHYPPAVTGVVAVEPDPYLRGLAAMAARSGDGPPIEVVGAVGEHLPFRDRQFDCAVTSLVLCTVPDLTATLGELKRVLLAHGSLHFYEHQAARGFPLSALQRAGDPLWSVLAGGCHVTRHLVDSIEAAGFTISELEPFPFAARFTSLLTRPHVMGHATAQ